MTTLLSMLIPVDSPPDRIFPFLPCPGELVLSHSTSLSYTGHLTAYQI